MTEEGETVTRQERRVSARTRFEVFKRDGFTCGYCARKTPQVVLEVDHIIPLAEGGGNEMENLITSCWECNRGKGASLLDDRAPVPDLHEQAIALLEKRRQLAEYNTVKSAYRDDREADVDDLYKYWCRLWREDQMSTYPSAASMRVWLTMFPAEDIKDAMDVAVGRNLTPWNSVRYLGGIIRNWWKELGDES